MCCPSSGFCFSSKEFNSTVKQYYLQTIYCPEAIFCSRTNMGRKAVLFGFWLLGYTLGFFAWLVRKPVISWIMNLGVSEELAGAFITGLAGSVVMLVGVILWSYMSSS